MGFIVFFGGALQMIDCFKSVIQLDLSGLKPETVLKSRVTRMTTLINAKKKFNNSLFATYSCC